jgi:cell wall-associated NlpC family hydrolase
MLKFAKRFIGTPYVWGGTTPSGFDCSGFTQYVFKKFGIDLPRVSADQGRMGKRISLDKLKPGELVFWDNSARNNGADHVAIYLGNGKIIEAPRPGRSVQISSMYDQANAWGVRL